MPDPFEIGVVMAGAVSAGAYTAGVFDSLVEALDAWHAAKSAGAPDAPPHEVRLKVLAGASAGAIVGAIGAAALQEEFPHVGLGAGPDDPGGRANKLFDAWVNRIDIEGLLGSADLDAREADPATGRPETTPVRSLLDSTALDRVGEFALSGGAPRAAPRPYLADPLHVVVTLTNLRGVPYEVGFTGLDVQKYRMNLHADLMHFAVGTKPHAGAEPVAGPVGGGGWPLLRDAAIASGAFPVGLAPRALARLAGWYADRRWGAVRGLKPAWPARYNDEGRYNFLAVDGGAIDNEPLGLARELLESTPGSFALVMVEPFPNTDPFAEGYDFDRTFTLYRLVPQVVRSLIDQARFKPDELARALDPVVFDQFLVTPTRREADGSRSPFDLASGGLGGFAGFLSRGFRAHDYHLGRYNGRRFLEKHFVLPERHPLFAGWNEAARGLHRVWRDAAGNNVPEGAPGASPFLPVVPLVATLRALEQPAWPAFYTAADLEVLRGQLKGRAQKVVQRLIDKLDNWLARRLLSSGWWLRRGDAVDDLVALIDKDLTGRGLRAAAPPRPGWLRRTLGL